MQESKPCVIMHKSGELMKYDPETKTLSLGKTFTVFPSRHTANSAKHHAVEHDRATIAEPWNEYSVVLMSDGRS